MGLSQNVGTANQITSVSQHVQIHLRAKIAAATYLPARRPLCCGEFNTFKFPFQDIIDLMCESRSDNNNAGEASLEVRVLFVHCKRQKEVGETQVITFQWLAETCLKSPDVVCFITLIPVQVVSPASRFYFFW